MKNRYRNTCCHLEKTGVSFDTHQKVKKFLMEIPPAKILFRTNEYILPGHN